MGVDALRGIKGGMDMLPQGRRLVTESAGSAVWVDMPLCCRIESTTMPAVELFASVKDVRPHWFDRVNEFGGAAGWEARPKWMSERWVHPFATRGHHPA
jgi:hypothetical protein